MKILKHAICMMVVSILLALVGCSKTDRPISNQPQLFSGKLSRILYNTGTYDSLYYLPNGQLGQVVNMIDPAANDGIRYRLLYDASGKLEKIMSSEGRGYRYQYDQGQFLSGL